MTEALIIFGGFILHLGIQSSNPYVRYVSNGALFGLLCVLWSVWAGVEAFEVIREFVQ